MSPGGSQVGLSLLLAWLPHSRRMPAPSEIPGLARLRGQHAGKSSCLGVHTCGRATPPPTCGALPGLPGKYLCGFPAAHKAEGMVARAQTESLGRLGVGARQRAAFLLPSQGHWGPQARPSTSV